VQVKSSGIPNYFPNQNDGYVKVSAQSTAVGYNCGLFVTLDTTRFGVQYISKTVHHLKGQAEFTNALPGFANQSITSDLTLPEMVNVHISKDFKNLTLSAEWYWIKNSELDSLDVKFKSLPTSSLSQKWRDINIVMIGASYHVDNITFNLGCGYNQSPVRDNLRSPRIPDSDRIWVSTGVKFNLTNYANISLGVTHLFFEKSTINTVNQFGYNLQGTINASTTIYGCQLSAKF
jgi:long-chain fatty acid transport protein